MGLLQDALAPATPGALLGRGQIKRVQTSAIDWKVTMTEGPVPRRTMLRALVGGGAAVSSALLLAACGSEESASTTDDLGYVAGDGTVVEIPSAERDEPAVFSGTTYEGETFESSEAPPDLLVVNVWYAACPPCRAEAPDLKAISEEYTERGVRFVGINTRDEAGPAMAFEETYGIAYPSLPDKDGQILFDLRGQVAPNAVPTTLVLDAEGRPAARITGAIDPATLRTMLDSLIAERDA